MDQRLLLMSLTDDLRWSPDLHQVGEAACSQIMAGPRHFGRLELAGDQVAAAIVEGSEAISAAWHSPTPAAHALPDVQLMQGPQVATTTLTDWLDAPHAAEASDIATHPVIHWLSGVCPFA